MNKHLRVLEGIVNDTSTNRGYRTIEHNVATIEQRKKKRSISNPEKKVTK